MSDIKKYRPSNGTESLHFSAVTCDVCKKGNEDDPANACPIAIAAFVFEIDDPKYPEAWRYDVSGKPTCTEFIHIEAEDDAAPRCPDTPDMFL